MTEEEAVKTVQKLFSEEHSKYVIDGRIEKASKGYYPSKSPYGYDRVNKILVPSPRNSKIVIRIFELWITDQYSIPTIIKSLQYAFGNPIPVKERVFHILKSRVYTGEFEYYNKLYVGNFPALISKDVWIKSVTLLKSRFPEKYSDFKI